MAQTYIGSDLNPSQVTSQVGYRAASGAEAGDEFYTHITMTNTRTNHKVGWVTVSTNFSGGYLNVRTGRTISHVGQSGRIISGSPFSFTVNYTQERNFIVVNIPQEIRSGFGLTFQFTAIDTTDLYKASFEVNSTVFRYDGNSHTCVSSTTNCSIESGTNTASAIGHYSVLLKADDAEPYKDACYFDVDGLAFASRDVDWQITDQVDKYVKLKVNGVWRNAIPHILTNGVFRKAQAYINTNGDWVSTDNQ